MPCSDRDSSPRLTSAAGRKPAFAWIGLECLIMNHSGRADGEATDAIICSQPTAPPRADVSEVGQDVQETIRMKLLDQSLKLTVIAGLLILGACSDSTSPDPTGESSVPMPDTLVSADWLKNHLDDPDLVVLDATVIVERDASGNLRAINGRANYESGHIPTAGFALAGAVCRGYGKARCR